MKSRRAEILAESVGDGQVESYCHRLSQPKLARQILIENPAVTFHIFAREPPAKVRVLVPERLFRKTMVKI